MLAKSKGYAFASWMMAIVILAALVLSCLPGGDLKTLAASTPTPAAEPPTPTIASTPTPLPPKPRVEYKPVEPGTISPVVLERTPARSATLPPEGKIQIVFDRAMNTQTVEAAFSIQPSVPGSLVWLDPRTMTFQPDSPLPRDALYDVILTQEAHAADGAPLAEPYVFRFFTPSYLEVGQVIPTPGTQDVEPSTIITVMFNRPVVPLTSLEEMEKLPQPLSFDPPVEGEGEWLNTSIYTFNPSQPLTGGTHYAAIVDATLSDTSGATMKEDFKWTFTVVPPKVVNQSPSPDSVLVPIEASLNVRFNQEIDPESAQAAFSLSQAGLLRSQPVKGTFTVRGPELTFKPDQWLEFDTDYEVKVAAGVIAPGGDEGMAESVIWRFKTVPRLKIVDTDPKNGERRAHPYSGFTLYFNAPVDPKTVMPSIAMDPPISATQLYTSSGHTSFHFSFGAQPSTEYEVRIGPDIADPYGNKTGQNMTIRFRTDDLPPRLSLHTPGRIATYNAYDPARIYVRYTNVNKARFTLWRIQEGIQDIVTNRFEDYGYTPRSQPIRAWDVPLEAPANEQSYAGIDLVEGGGLLEPGIYMLEVRPEKMDFNQWSHRHILVVSRVNMVLKSGPYEMLAWATDLRSGDPLPGIPLIFSERGQNPRTWQKTTDAQGVASLSNNTGGWEYHGLVAYSQSPFAIISSDWGNGISPWDFGLEASYGVQDFRLHIYTDRPIYRPSQTVEFKGVVRTEDDAQYSMPSGIRDVFVTIYDAAYEELYSETLAVSEMGAFFGTLELSDSAALGTYTIQVNFGDEYLEHYFQVAAYRPPEFEVVVTPDKTELAHGSGTQATVDVKYFFGGPMAGAPVEWNIVAQTYRFTPPWGGRYRFTDVDDPWICFDCWWWHDPVPATPILRGSGRTDNNGQLLIEIPPELVDVNGKPITESVRLIIEATAAGKDNQFISGRASVTVHRGNYYIGLAPQKYVNQAEREALVDLVAVDWEGTRLAGKEISISIFRREWQNIFLETATGGYWDWSTKDLLIERVTVQTDDQGQAIASFVPSQGGSYHFIAEGKDAQGRTVRSSIFVWVAGKEHVSWRRDNNDRINLIADKVKYNPGETAEILIPSPFEGPHWALITVERGHIKQHEVVQMVTNSYVYELPITADLVPNIYFSVVLVKGQDQTSKLADYKVGLLPIEVDLVEQELNIEIAPKVEQAEPGQEVTYDLKVTDFEGNPVRAEFSLDLVDKAVLTLNPRSPNAILDAFYSRRGLAVYTACGLTISGNRIVQQIEEELELERGDARATPSPMTTATPSAVELEKALDTAMAEVAPAAEEPAMAGAPPPAPPPGVELREEFADTAYWNPAIMTDNAGRASVALTLPDNLTTWVMRGVGMTTKTTVGEGTHELVVAKPLMVRPVAPRFFVVDDRAQLAALITNNTGQAIQAEVALSSSGLELASAEIQTITIPPHAESKVTWEVKVLDVPEAELIFSAVSTDGEHSDASRPRLATLPDGRLLVLRYSAPDIVGTAGQIDGAGSRTEVIALPPRFNERQGEVSIQVDPSLAASMQDGLQYLEHFEYECTEQTVSRFLPNVLTWRALKELGISDPELEAKLPSLVEEGLSKLYVQQHGDGGWGWWTKNDSNVHVTTYVLFALLKARQAGFEVRPDVIERAEGYLIPHLAQEIGNSWEANRQAYVLYVLAEDGKAPRNSIAAIYEKRDHLSYYGKAYLTLAIWLGNEEDERINTLLSDINNGAILSATGAHWEEDALDWWAMNTDTRTTAIILDTLARIDTANALIPNVVRWLMMARKFGIWETTQETAWALIAFTDWMRATGELDANYEYSIFLNDKELAARQVTRETVREGTRLQVAMADLLRDVGNTLTIARTDGPGRIYYTAHLRVFLPVEELEPVDRGIIVSRRYTLADCQDGPRCPQAREVKLGDVIRVDLTIIAPADLYYVVVEDPIPAGTEAIDTGLATTSMLAMDPSLRRRRPEEESWWSYYYWWWNWYSRSELRDEKVVLFADYLPKGTYEYSYTMRATLPGDYQVIPTLASQFYFPEAFGRGEGRKLTIGRGAE